MLKSVKRLTIASDIWTKRGNRSSFLGVTATCYYPPLKKKVNIMLGVQRFNTVTHKASDIIREIRKVMARFEITSKQSTSDFSFSGRDKDSDNSSGDNSADNARSEEEIPEGISEIDQVGEVIEKEKLKELIEQMKMFVSKFSRSHKLTEDLVKETGVGLVSFSETSWNYFYLVLLRVETEVNLVLKNNGIFKYVVKSEDWAKIKQITAFLKPSHDYTSASNIMDSLKNKFSKWFHDINNDFEGTYVVSTLLDPRFRLMLPPDQRALGIQFLLNEYKLIISEETESNTNIANETRSETPLMPIKSRFPLVQEMKQAILSSQPLRENQSVLKFEAELNKYLSGSDYDNCMEDMDVFEFWSSRINQYPLLARE
ncbi:unnamed protein product [Allacma fusca]|uniref:Uncharacterized protein n=1 Tax=Allacma fusca TaxID=39272 RepID=A0A8J2L6R4_9HEXA|nr:unnamed protein product [Allacma fusca]